MDDERFANIFNNQWIWIVIILIVLCCFCSGGFGGGCRNNDLPKI
jgi:hypothetical protein